MPRNFRGSVKGPIWLGLSMFLDRKHGFDRNEEYMVTCKWCYLQVIPTLEDRHFECKKKIRKQIRIRKANIEGLASATDRRFLAETKKGPLKVIGSRWLKG
jgi:hypothetical protein